MGERHIISIRAKQIQVCQGKKEEKDSWSLEYWEWHGVMFNSSAITNLVWMQMAPCSHTALLITVLEFWVSKGKNKFMSPILKEENVSLLGISQR